MHPLPPSTPPRARRLSNRLLRFNLTMEQQESDRAKEDHGHARPPLRATESAQFAVCKYQTQPSSLLDTLDLSRQFSVVAPSETRNEEISQLDHLPILSEDPSSELHRRMEHLERTTVRTALSYSDGCGLTLYPAWRPSGHLESASASGREAQSAFDGSRTR
jgi:hypothetical protein